MQAAGEQRCLAAARGRQVARAQVWRGGGLSLPAGRLLCVLMDCPSGCLILWGDRHQLDLKLWRTAAWSMKVMKGVLRETQHIVQSRLHRRQPSWCMPLVKFRSSGCMLLPDVGRNPVAAAPSTAQQSVAEGAQAAPPGRSASASQGRRHPDGPRRELHRGPQVAALPLSPGHQEDPQHCPLDGDSNRQQQSPNQQHLQETYGGNQDGLSSCCLPGLHYPG